MSCIKENKKGRIIEINDPMKGIKFKINAKIPKKIDKSFDEKKKNYES